MSNPIVRIEEIKMVQVSQLVPHPKNPNKHPADQIARLASIIEFQGWRYPIKVSTRSGFVTSGHGRILAAQLRGWDEVPVSYQEYETEAQEYADVVSDNAIAEWAELDLAGINADIVDFGPDFDIDLLGLRDFVLDPSEKEENPYTNKIESPIYEPKGPKPDVKELTDLAKCKVLVKEIEASSLPDEEKLFLTAAAYRHIVFDYEKIAEYYAQSKPDTQDLMEKSALVIIDFDKAIENGFVTLTKKLAETYQHNEG